MRWNLHSMQHSLPQRLDAVPAHVPCATLTAALPVSSHQCDTVALALVLRFGCPQPVRQEKVRAPVVCTWAPCRCARIQGLLSLVISVMPCLYVRTPCPAVLR